jgi:hypothetical protein
VVAPDFDAVAVRLLRVDIKPDVVHVQVLDCSPAEVLEGRAVFPNGKALRPVLLAIPADPLPTLARSELVVCPKTVWESFAEVADSLAVDPKRLFAVGIIRSFIWKFQLHSNACRRCVAPV